MALRITPNTRAAGRLSIAANQRARMSSIVSIDWDNITGDVPDALFGIPTASVGLTAINGSADTAMRSDAAPALDQSIDPTWTGLHIFNEGWTFDIEQPTLTAPFPSFNGDELTNFKVGSSGIIRWTGSMTNGATALTGQSVVTTTADLTGNGGEVGGVYGGALNQKSTAAPYGVLGVIYNDDNATTPGGNALYGVVRGTKAAIGVRGMTLVSETVSGQHPEQAIYIGRNGDSDNEFRTGVQILNALNYGFEVGTHLGAGSGVLPEYPFAYYATPSVLNWAILANATQVQTLTANNTTALTIKRFTDTAPTGNFLDFQSAAAASIFTVSVAGNAQGRQYQATTPIDVAGFVATDGTVTVNLGPSSNNTNSAYLNVSSNHPLVLGTNNTAWARLNTNGTVVLGAYGTGILHSSSIGTITSSAVNLASADVTGDLPFANLAQGSARSVLANATNATADFASLQSGASGQILNSTASAIAWTATPTLGLAGTTTGTLGLAGSTSGTATITAQAAAGTPTLTLPNASGTFAVSVSAPLALSATTGNLTITGAAGQVLAGSTPAFTATPVLGVAGSTVGTLGFQNATSGTITLSPTTGALGTVTLTMPAVSSTLATLAAQTFSGNQTFPGSIIIGTGVATGILGDGTNIAVRTPTGGTLFIQNTSGGTTWGQWTVGGLQVIGTSASTLRVDGSVANTAVSTYYNGPCFFYKATNNANNQTLAIDFRIGNASSNSFAAIVGQVTDVTDGAVKGVLAFSVANAAGAASEAMRVTVTGGLNIGATADVAAGGLNVNAIATLAAGTATPAGGSTAARMLFGTTAGFGIYYGSGAPSVSAAQGSIYLRSDGSSTSTRLYVNTTGSTTWTNFTSAA